MLKFTENTAAQFLRALAWFSDNKDKLRPKNQNPNIEIPYVNTFDYEKYFNALDEKLKMMEHAEETRKLVEANAKQYLDISQQRFAELYCETLDKKGSVSITDIKQWLSSK